MTHEPSPMPWVKIYTEILDDPKIGKLSNELRWRYVELILVAGECDQEGWLTRGLEAMTVVDLAWRLRSNTSDIQRDLDILKANNLIEFTDGAWFVTKFSERQGRPQKEKRRQWREAQKRKRVIDDVPEPVIHDAPDNVIADSCESHTPRGEERREEGEERREEEESSAATAKSFEIVSEAYKSEIGPITATIMPLMQEALTEYSPDWIVAALSESAKNNKRSWAYAVAILKRWKKDGYKSPRSNGRERVPDYTVGLPDHDLDPIDDPPPELDDSPLQVAWRHITQELQPDMLRGAYETYVKTIVPIDLQDGVVSLQVPGAHQRDWLQSRMDSTLVRKFAGVLGQDVKISYQILDQVEVVN